MKRVFCNALDMYIVAIQLSLGVPSPPYPIPYTSENGSACSVEIRYVNVKFLDPMLGTESIRVWWLNHFYILLEIRFNPILEVFLGS